MSDTLCANCGKPISQLGISYLYEWRHNHSGSVHCDAPAIAIPAMTEDDE